ncbi:D-Ala-D-Ala carboxypeptidase family metallohydrolase [Gemmata sp. JC717]|uniref:D-Ala-D-Ala carboxypeptidase family metallohydrolase n=1 Tax=Gemmata algarum TaxID=2975278 RepID=UPI0021BAC24F|nr:D-Ala-D-Ala carboxypeptidase family metallohydrolase [Gemmata algarum]MDY3551380.1 D-Ala-D-Ala carboxypeptidase family metallohydrolase [Gemmata algarum]
MNGSYFTTDELKCKCCGQCVLAPGFLDKLNEIRERLGNMMIINSGCRCERHNAALGGKGRSFHLINAPRLTGLVGACAVDVSTVRWPDAKRDKLIRLARKGGWSLGIATSFIHIDRRTDYPETKWPRRAEWTY